MSEIPTWKKILGKNSKIAPTLLNQLLESYSMAISFFICLEVIESNKDRVLSSGWYGVAKILKKSKQDMSLPTFSKCLRVFEQNGLIELKAIGKGVAMTFRIKDKIGFKEFTSEVEEAWESKNKSTKEETK